MPSKFMAAPKLLYSTGGRKRDSLSFFSRVPFLVPLSMCSSLRESAHDITPRKVSNENTELFIKLIHARLKVELERS